METQSQLMNIEEVKRQLIEWLNRGKYSKNWDDHMDADDNHVKVILFTDNHSYSIIATTSGYLGCTTTSRKPRAGEDWTRGNDLADGQFSEETWNCILSDILSYELVSTERPIREMLAERKAG